MSLKKETKNIDKTKIIRSFDGCKISYEFFKSKNKKRKLINKNNQINDYLYKFIILHLFCI